MPEINQNRVARIRTLNDKLRCNSLGGRIVITAGLAALGPENVERVRKAVVAFNTFTESDDPYGEHDFGSVEIDGETFFWKIDYYDLKLEFGSEDPSDPDKTTRVLTIMRSEEY